MLHSTQDVDDITARVQKAGPKLVVVSFTDDISSPSLLLSDLVQLLDECYYHDNVLFITVDCDNAVKKIMSRKYRLADFPMSVFYKNEHEVGRIDAIGIADRLPKMIHKYK
ncbi:hypothetical protein ASPWEDRAFT_169430 [Aspergillus wentii DTO 134E9]|uniref:Thioredoxin domain-containing protein n=1 Tax=Aspergillus wentii DTO 134E9 TaxID=1073089 RepID=A0A1L9RXH0_ASPWE|nr:uncharacterized protein ASPWEDRAFT_169430 [Aspergillus wentii DTO 134E9]KAI9931728.1 hypothetical protein MW887_010307 [Aspergillus wentii]OJJ39593.1 hypothetical protein ASPWEDRAFT_169430 [Aspergillus wentii DTO 134E9]